MKQAGILASFINHDDRSVACCRGDSPDVRFVRHYGAVWCAMRSLPSDDISRLGGWTTNKVQMKNYERVLSMESIVRIADYDDVSEYFLERAVLDPFEIGDPDIKALASGIYPSLDNKGFEAIIDKVGTHWGS